MVLGVCVRGGHGRLSCMHNNNYQGGAVPAMLGLIPSDIEGAVSIEGRRGQPLNLRQLSEGRKDTVTHVV
jgi:hypothetical protein